jgi:hypothetical protein
MTNRKHSHDYAETEVLSPQVRPSRVEALDGAAAEEHGHYQEYLRSLDEVPVLVDVVREPPRVVIRVFRLGQRSDVRKSARDDAAALRERHARELEQRYAEYAAICAGLVSAPRSEPRKASKPGSKKKRAKRAKRSARSKS